MELEEGAVSRYYPPDSTAEERDRFGVCLATVDGHVWEAGDHDVAFPLQSISKVFAYALALDEHGRDAVRKRVGVEPSGDAFNSIVFDERAHRPFNPMVNAGAIVTADLVAGEGREEKLGRILELVRTCAGNDAIDVDRGLRARAAGGRPQPGDRLPDAQLGDDRGRRRDDARALLRAVLDRGHLPRPGHDGGDARQRRGQPGRPGARRSRARPSATCSASCTLRHVRLRRRVGDEVGVPPRAASAAASSPSSPASWASPSTRRASTSFGNSVRGIRVCEEISERLGLHVFATEDEDKMLSPGPAGS